MPWRHEFHVFQLQLQIGSKKLGTSASKELCHLVSRVVKAFLGGGVSWAIKHHGARGSSLRECKMPCSSTWLLQKCYVERSEIHASELAIWMLSQTHTFQFVVVRGDICKCECSLIAVRDWIIRDLWYFPPSKQYIWDNNWCQLHALIYHFHASADGENKTS